MFPVPYRPAALGWVGSPNSSKENGGVCHKPPFPLEEFFGAYIKPPDDALRRATEGTTQRGGRSTLAPAFFVDMHTLVARGWVYNLFIF
jgi:hypothetical protein